MAFARVPLSTEHSKKIVQQNSIYMINYSTYSVYEIALRDDGYGY